MTWLSAILLIETLLLIISLFIIIRIKLQFNYTTSFLTSISIFFLYVFLVGRILGDYSLFTTKNLLISNSILFLVLLISIFSSKIMRTKLFAKSKYLLSKTSEIRKISKDDLKDLFLKIIHFEGLLFLILFLTFLMICCFVPITSPNMLFQDLVAMEWILENGSLPPINVPYILQKNNPYLEFFTGGVFQIILVYTFMSGGKFLLRALTPIIAILSILAVNQLMKNLNLEIKKSYFVFGIILSPIFLHYSTVASSDIFVVLFTITSLLIVNEISNNHTILQKSLILNLAFAISILSFAVKFYGIISIYLCFLFYWKTNKQLTKENKHPFSKQIIFSLFLPLFLLTVVFERNINLTANILPPYSLFFLPMELYSVPALVLALVLSLVIILVVVLISFYESKIKYSQIAWWSLVIISYIVCLFIFDPMILPNYLKLALFSFKTGDIVTTFGPYVLVLLAFYIFKKSKLISSLPKDFHYYTEIIIKGFVLILLSQVLVLQHFSEGPVRYSFSMLFLLYPAVGILLQLLIENRNYQVKDKNFKKIQFIKITQKSSKQLLRIGYVLALLYMFLGGPLGYLNPPGYLFIAPYQSDSKDLQHWRPYVANAINYINENMNEDEYALFTDPYVYLFDNPLNILTFTPNPDHRNRVIYERIRSYGNNITTDELIDILIEFKIKYFVTVLGYSLDLLIENTPIIGETLNLAISPMVFYEEDNTIFSSESRYAAIWMFNY